MAFVTTNSILNDENIDSPIDIMQSLAFLVGNLQMNINGRFVIFQPRLSVADSSSKSCIRIGYQKIASY